MLKFENSILLPINVLKMSGQEDADQMSCSAVSDLC